MISLFVLNPLEVILALQLLGNFISYGKSIFTCNVSFFYHCIHINLTSLSFIILKPMPTTSFLL